MNYLQQMWHKVDKRIMHRAKWWKIWRVASMSENEDKAKALIENGIELAGAAATGAIGVIAGEPLLTGALAAGGLGLTKALIKDGGDFLDRLLGPRERVRIGAAAAFAVERIRRNHEQGLPLRSDDFFDEDASRRSKAEELLEGVLLKSKNAHEEKKARYLGNLFGNIAFTEEADIGLANFALSLTERMTYRQMCSLWLFEMQTTINAQFPLKRSDYGGAGAIPLATDSLLHEIFDLYQIGLIFRKGEDGANALAMLGFYDIAPADIRTNQLGHALTVLLGLDDIPKEDIASVIALLQ